jgi:type VI protein secretion system component Hcp
MRDVLVTSVTALDGREAVGLSFQDSKVTTKHGGIVDTEPVTGMYLDIKGITGDVTDPGFEGQIDILAYSWIATSGPGEITLTKNIDSSSAAIFAIVVSGTPLKAARLTVAETVNGRVYSSMTIDLRDVMITSVVTGGETESITLSFQRSKITQ